MDDLKRRKLLLDIRDFHESLNDDESFCNGCSELHIITYSGARGQVITAFNDGVCTCNVIQQSWAYNPKGKQERPLECILCCDKQCEERCN